VKGLPGTLPFEKRKKGRKNVYKEGKESPICKKRKRRSGRPGRKKGKNVSFDGEKKGRTPTGSTQNNKKNKYSGRRDYPILLLLPREKSLSK